MQFQIPQFIELEDKIAGPFTLKQLLYVLAAGGLSFLLFFVLKFWLWIILTMIFATTALSFAFLKYNGQPLIKAAARAFNFFWHPRFYLWKREIEKEKIVLPELEEATPEARRRSLSEFVGGGMSSVKKLWQDMTTSKNPIPRREKTIPIEKAGAKKQRFEIFRKKSGEKEVVRRVDYR